LCRLDRAHQSRRPTVCGAVDCSEHALSSPQRTPLSLTSRSSSCTPETCRGSASCSVRSQATRLTHTHSQPHCLPLYCHSVSDVHVRACNLLIVPTLLSFLWITQASPDSRVATTVPCALQRLRTDRPASRTRSYRLRDTTARMARRRSRDTPIAAVSSLIRITRPSWPRPAGSGERRRSTTIKSTRR
jgi:hypothetical protein